MVRAIITITFLTLGAVSYATSLDTAATGSNTPGAISIGWVGDMVPSDSEYNATVFSDVQRYLEKPDLMIGNLEGTFATELTNSKCNYIDQNCYAFSGDASFADALKSAGFDFISLVNNHSNDYGEQGLADTMSQLDRVGIPYITSQNPSISVRVKGRKIGIIGLSSTDPFQTISDYDFIKEGVEKLQQRNDYVIVIFHGGAEGSDKTEVPGKTEYLGTENRGDVERVAYTAVDAGADLVLGAGPHVLRKIEVYKEVPIAFSLGNFVGGEGRLITTGVLALSGIFTTDVTDNTPAGYQFLPITLSPDGVPMVDLLERSLELLKSL